MEQPPQDSASRTDKPAMKIRKGTAADLTTPPAVCHACGRPVSASTVLCPHCGQFVKTGARPRRQRRMAWGKMAWGLLLAGVAVAAYRYYPQAREWAPKHMEDLKSQRRAYVTQLFDEQAPLHTVGETVTFKRVDGKTAAGRFCGLGPGGVLFETSRSNLAHIAMRQLDVWTQIAVDEPLRFYFIEKNLHLPGDLLLKSKVLLGRAAVDWPLDMTLPVGRQPDCATCHGRGQVACTACGGRGHFILDAAVPCKHCHGTGAYATMGGRAGPCPFCKGTGNSGATTYQPCEACGATGMTPCPDCSQPNGRKGP